MADSSSFSIDRTGSDMPVENLFLKFSREVDRWFLMDNPVPVIMIVGFYLLFVIKLGPEYMKDRKPLNIKFIILIYNLYQTIYNLFIVSKMFTTPGAVHYIWKHCCHPIDPAVNPYYHPVDQTYASDQHSRHLCRPDRSHHLLGNPTAMVKP
ncbi:hypothetical protein PGB90_001969 [Kerria lacca]